MYKYSCFHSDVYSPSKKTLAVCKVLPATWFTTCDALVLCLVRGPFCGLLWCRHLITCASEVCCIFIAIHCQHCSYVMYMFSGKSHFDVVMWVTCVHSQWAGLVFVYIYRRLRINQLIELRSKWNYGIYGTHQNGLFTFFFCRFVISKTRVTLLHMHRCQFYSAWFLIGSYCTGDWKLKILIAICSWHSITSRIGKILVANASKLVAPYSTEPVTMFAVYIGMQGLSYNLSCPSFWQVTSVYDEQRMTMLDLFIQY